jgi:magnesium chelatase subunit I
VELETAGEDAPEERIVERLVTRATFATFGRRATVGELDSVVEAFEAGLVLETGDRVASRDYVRWAHEIPGLREAIVRLGTFDASDGAEEPALVASAVEFLLEGLHLHRRLNKDRVAGGVAYRR